MRHILLLFLLSINLLSYAQVSEKYASQQSTYYRAEDLFEKEQYSAARKEFHQFITEYKGLKNDPFYIKALYYEGISALELFNNDAIDLLESFNREYPESIYKYDIVFRIGKYYYQKKNYEKAIEYFQQLKRQNIEPEYLTEYYFKLGYANFHEKQYPTAKLAFYEVKDSTESQYGAPSLYYYSHICYLDSSYQTALEGFERLLSDARFNAVVPYYITQIYYMQGKYQQVVDFAVTKVDSLKPAEQVEVNHIIGDSYYRLGKYDEAVPFLEAYNAKSATSRDDDYALATAYAKSSNCVKAVKYYDKVARIKDTLGQIALYHAGECYTNLEQLLYARNAFEEASQLDMDKMIQEDALYNYAILSYKLDLNAYDEAVEAFELYLSKYPDSPRKQVVYQYLVNVYSSTKNYAKAMESLDRLPNKDIKLKSAYQVIAYNRGIELYQKGDYALAISAFKKVETYPLNQDVSAKAVYWSADADFQQKKYASANEKYTAFLSMPSTYLSGLRQDAYYNKGYCFLYLEDYPRTAEAFRNYLKETNLTDKRKKADAYMRLADEYYRVKDNPLAVENYKAAYNLKSGYEDQALYYLARTEGFMGKREEKIVHLLDIINNYHNSKYVQRSVEDVARTYYSLGNLDKAERYYTQIITDYPTSSAVIDAHHYLGDIAFKRNELDKAEKKYKYVLDNFTVNDTICLREVYSLADVYKRQNNLSKKEGLASLYSCADSIATSVEGDYYGLAFKSYEDSLYTDALSKFDTYLTKFPSGKYYRDAMNYKADCLYKTKRPADAIAVYRITLQGPNDDFTETAAQRTSKYLFNNGEREAALPYYERLEQVTSSPELKNSSKIGQMRCHFLLENFTNAADYATKVLSITQPTALKLEAEYIKGVSLAKSNQFLQGLSSLEYVVKNTTTAIGAECKYTIAWGYFQQGELDKSESVVRELLKMKPGYDYWIAKGLILQTRSLMQKKDLFQAENTIKSVINNYPVKDDGILTEANELYDEIMQLKTQPKAIEKSTEPTIIDVEEKSGN